MKNIFFILFCLLCVSSHAQKFDVKYYMETVLYMMDKDSTSTNIGLMDSKGKILKEPSYANGVALNNTINIKKGGVFGYLNGNNEKLFPQFKQAVWDGNYGIARNGEKKFALVDSDGNLLTEYLFNEIRRVSDDYYYVNINNKGNYISLKGKIIFDTRYNMSDQGIKNAIGCYISANKKYGFVKTDGTVIIEPVYNKIYGDETSEYWVAEQNGKFGILDETCNVMIPLLYSQIAYVPESGALIPVELNKKFGYINEHNEIVIPFIYNKALPFIDGYAIVNKDGKYGYIDKANNEIAFFGKEAFWIGEHYFNDGLAIFKADGKYGFINKKGKVIVAAEYENVENFKNGLALVRKDKKFGFINTQGEVVIPIKYSFLSRASNGKILFQ